jgi:L-alanine-DL-glutamate epimerase-like enolase superfamily enzyme
MTATVRGDAAPITDLRVATYIVPTDEPESDGTLTWDKTTMVLVELEAGGLTGIGYTYADRAAADVVLGTLRERVLGQDVMNVPLLATSMMQAVRNLGQRGVATMAVSAVDAALWDAKAKILGLPLTTLLGAARVEAAVYGSGGFTSYSISQLCRQLGGWVEAGIPRVKMKIGREPAADVQRVCAVRQAIGPGPELFVDANGAYDTKQALAIARQLADADAGVTWFEEPVSSDDLAGLGLIRAQLPAPMRVAAGEYGYRPQYFARMLAARSVDVLQADATRCGGPSGFLQAAALADAEQIPLSAHCAPALHLHLCLCAPRYLNLEYFHDHVRIERMFFDGAQAPTDGALRADLTRPGLGLELKRNDAERFRA